MYNNCKFGVESKLLFCLIRNEWKDIWKTNCKQDMEDFYIKKSELLI